MPGRTAVALAGGSLALGLLAILAASAGAHSRTPLVALFVAVGLVAALIPLRYGLAIAVVVACFVGFLHDFAGGRALYWNEAFAATIVARSVVARRPTRAEAIGVAVAAAIFAGYLASGTSLRADAWGFKVLLTSVAIGWALTRLPLGRNEWRGVYYGLAVVAGASLVLAVWQRAKGVEGLRGLGLFYGQRIREVSGGGQIRAFAGFTSAAPYSYALAITLCVWLALLLGDARDRRDAVLTAWVPPCVAGGMALAVDRTAVLGFTVALLILAVVYRPRILLPPTLAVAVIVAAVAVTSSHSRTELTSAAQARASLWQEYLRDFSVFGAGPASAGSAYDKVAPDWRAPLRVPNSWNVDYHEIDIPATSGPVVQTRLKQRPPLVLTATARSLDVARQLTATLYGSGQPRRVLSRTISPGRPQRLAIRLPGGPKQSAALLLDATHRPKAVEGQLVNRVANPSVETSTAGWVTYDQFVHGVLVSRSARAGRFGSASLRIADAQDATPTRQGSGVFYTPVRVVEGRVYTVSAYLRGSAGGETVHFVPIDSLDPTAEILHSPTLPLTREWRRHAFTFRATSTTTGLLILIEPRVETQAVHKRTFFVDGLQVERGRRATEYCDGSVPHCRWAGAPHASPSYRAPSTRLTAALAASPADVLVHVRTTLGTMPAGPPLVLSVGRERLEVLATVGRRAYRVRRAAEGTKISRHPAGARVWAEFPSPDVAAPPTGAQDHVIALRDVRVDHLPPPLSHAERIWNRWFHRTPAALEGDGPGLVDNLYVSWLFQYGLPGGLLCCAWLGLCLWPLVRRRDDPRWIAVTTIGVFLAVAAVAVNVWEESPTDLLAAFVFANAYAATRRAASPAAPGPQ